MFISSCMFFKTFPTCKFILYCASIWYTRVCTISLFLERTTFTLKRANGLAHRSAEVQKSAREFSHGLDFRPNLDHLNAMMEDCL